MHCIQYIDSRGIECIKHFDPKTDYIYFARFQQSLPSVEQNIRLPSVDTECDNPYDQRAHGNPIQRILGIQGLSGLRRLVLSYHEIKTLEGLDNVAPQLDALIIEGGSLISMRGIEKFKSLTQLTLSGGTIKKIEGLEGLTKLEAINLSSNRIETIEGLGELKFLQYLDLGINRIKCVEGLENLRALKSLNLGYNQIQEIKPGVLEDLKNLEHLKLNSNQLHDGENIRRLIRSMGSKSLDSVDLSINKLYSKSEKMISRWSKTDGYITWWGNVCDQDWGDIDRDTEK